MRKPKHGSRDSILNFFLKALFALEEFLLIFLRELLFIWTPLASAASLGHPRQARSLGHPRQARSLGHPRQARTGARMHAFCRDTRLARYWTYCLPFLHFVLFLLKSVIRNLFKGSVNRLKFLFGVEVTYPLRNGRINPESLKL